MQRPTPRSLSGAEAVRGLLQAEDLARDAERVRHDDGVRDALRVEREVGGSELKPGGGKAVKKARKK